MNTGKSQIFLNDIFEQNSEIIISYNTDEGVEIINRLYTRCHYLNHVSYPFFVIAIEKSKRLADGTVCTINSQSLKEFNIRVKLFRTNKLKFDTVCSELKNYYQYESPETSFEIFEAIDITVV